MKKYCLTVGYRARILPAKSESLKEHQSFWREVYANREVLLIERNRGANEFSAMVLREGKYVPLKKRDGKTVDDQIAWVSENELVLVDTDLKANLDFIDWYQLNDDKFCPDCGVWFPNNGLSGHSCPNKKCPSHKLDKK
jgi:hypothetical protein